MLKKIKTKWSLRIRNRQPTYFGIFNEGRKEDLNNLILRRHIDVQGKAIFTLKSQLQGF